MMRVIQIFRRNCDAPHSSRAGGSIRGSPSKERGSKQNHRSFKKWLRYYLDFCEKYQFPAARKESLPEFLGKLREKRQTRAQQEQGPLGSGLHSSQLREWPLVLDPDK